MTVYYVLLLLFTIVTIFASYTTKPSKITKKVCICGFLIFSALLCLRHPSMGIDLGYGRSNGYLAMYKEIAESNWIDVYKSSFLNYERGYVVFNKVLGYISKDPQILLIGCGIICMASISLFIYKNSKHPYLSFIIYIGLPCFLINFSGLRQALAIAITCMSFEMIKRKKPVRFILFVIFASLFHSSALIFLLAYPCFNIRTDDPTFKLLSILLLPIVFLFKYQIFTVASKVFKPDATPEYTASYTLFVVFSLIYIFTLILQNKMSDEVIGYRNLFYIACIFQAFSAIYSTAMRLGYYFMVFLILLLPEIIFSFGKTHEKFKFVLYLVFFICFASFGLYMLSSKTSWAMTNPYRFFWE